MRILRLNPALRIVSLLPLLAASHATSQESIDSLQTQGGNVVASQKLNVEVNVDLVQTGTEAAANSLNGGTKNLSARLRARQDASASTIAVTTLNGTNTGKFDAPVGTPVYLDSRATGNAVAMTAVRGDTQLEVAQTHTGPQVYAETGLNAPNNSVYESGQGFATATANQTMIGNRDGQTSGTVSQSSDAYTQARVSADVAYSPSPSLYSASATQNYLSFNGKGASSLDMTSSQTATATTEASASLKGNNLWHPQVTADAAANMVDLGNTGGALVNVNTQVNRAQVLSNASVAAGQWSDGYVTANATGNSVYAGNEDVYVNLDNTQFSEGGQGIVANAAFSGGAGYDATVTATATGNSAYSYACSECQADFNATNRQSNASDVTATATVSAGSSRSVVSNARAVGNTATFYVTGK